MRFFQSAARTLAALVVVFQSGAGNAKDLSDAYAIRPPETYAEMPGMSEKMATTASQGWYLDTRDVEVGARAWARAGRGALYLMWFSAREPSTSPESSIRAAFDLLREAPVVASPQVGSTLEVSYSEEVTDDLGRARLSWKHLSNETSTTAVALSWADPSGRVQLIRAECVVGTEPNALSECESSLASLTINVKDRRKLGDIGVSAQPEPPSAVGAMALPDAGSASASSGSAGSDPPSASISAAPQGAGGQRVLYEGESPRGKGTPIQRYLMLFGGLLLALGLYSAWSRRKGEDRGRDEDGEDEDGEDGEGEGDEGRARDGDGEDQSGEDGGRDGDDDGDESGEDDEADDDGEAGDENEDETSEKPANGAKKD